MVCKEHLINALTQTHRALTAYAQCIEETSTEQERNAFQDITLTLATQAKILQEKLVDEYTRCTHQ